MTKLPTSHQCRARRRPISQVSGETVVYKSSHTTFALILINLFLTFAGLPAAGSEFWSPSTVPQAGVGRECHSQLWSWKFLNEGDQARRALLLKEFIETCTPRLHLGRAQGTAAQKQQMTLRTSSWKLNPFFFSDRQTHRQQGWYILQDGKARRPAVVVSCDFECDPKRSVWLRRVLMHLYDEGPFHVVIVPTNWWAGGILTGQNIYEVGYWLQTVAPIRQRISSLQLLGEGYGAQGTLFAQIYNEHNPIASDRKVFQGGLALCPAVSLDSLTTPNISNPTVEQTNFTDALKLRLLQELGLSWDSDLRAQWLKTTVSATAKWTFLNPFRVNPPTHAADWLQASDIAYQGIRFTVPNWLVGSRGDPRFTWRDHGGRLSQQNRDPKKTNLKSQAIEDSSSCAYGVTLGWDVEGAVWRSLLLSQSYEIWPRGGENALAWNEAGPELAPNEIHLEQEWLVRTTGEVSISYLIAGDNGKRRSVEMAVDTTHWPQELKPDVSDDASAEVWQRRLNVRLRLMSGNEPLLETHQFPTRLIWWGW